MEQTYKVSVVIPVYNVEKYLRQCLDSVVNQTLKEIEIICVNDGSKDTSLSILQEYAAKDPRVKIIDKQNSGYGNSMNRGFDMASGEYFGIVESDDYADPEMFEKLYQEAKKYNADVVKSGFYYYFSVPEERNTLVPVASAVMCNRVFCPITDFKSKTEQADFFNIKPTIWSAIYKKEFIRENGIRFNETPGASYQDLSFTFKVWSLAKRVKLVEECYLHYRQDNENSSVNSPGKVYCVCDEYAEIEKFINNHPILKAKLEPVKTRLQYDTYIWNYERLAENLKGEFILQASKEFANEMAEGNYEQAMFPWYKWNALNLIIHNPQEYHRWRTAEREGRAYNVQMIPQESFTMKVRRKLIGGYWCWKEHGFIYTLKNLMHKIKRRLFK